MQAFLASWTSTTLADPTFWCGSPSSGRCWRVFGFFRIKDSCCLSPKTITLTEDGYVKIVGVEESCRILNEDMHADTLKLTALAVIVEQLMDRVAATMEAWKESYSWGPEINSFLQVLRKKPLDELLKDPFLASQGFFSRLVSL
ncbi:hypothetical protein BDV06DRAFT_228840 [Aspergillus oleicola]